MPAHGTALLASKGRSYLQAETPASPEWIIFTYSIGDSAGPANRGSWTVIVTGGHDAPHISPHFPVSLEPGQEKHSSTWRAQSKEPNPVAHPQRSPGSKDNATESLLQLLSDSTLVIRGR